MRVWAIGVLVVTVCLALPVGARGADQTVHAVGAADGDYGPIPDHFTPATVGIAPGESVTFVNDAGMHNVRFQDGLFTSPATPLFPEGWPTPPAKRTFAQAGTYNFLCDMHGALGMKGTVIVGTSATAPRPTPNSPRPGSPVVQPGALRIEALSAARRRFCNKRGKRCRRPGVRFRIDLSRAGRVTGTLSRRPLKGRGRARRFGEVRFGEVMPGGTELSFRRTSAGRRLPRGRYAMTVRAGNDTRVLRFSIVSA